MVVEVAMMMADGGRGGGDGTNGSGEGGMTTVRQHLDSSAP